MVCGETGRTELDDLEVLDAPFLMADGSAVLAQSQLCPKPGQHVAKQLG